MILVPATVHGRVLIDNDEGAAVSPRMLVGFHGYGQSAEDMLEELRRIPGADQWTRVSIQALNRFYTRGDAKVVANWMTREDREQAIADNIAYVDAAVDRVLGGLADVANVGRGFSRANSTDDALVFVGFSQGVAMAYRAALMGARPVAGIIALAGDIPPELRTEEVCRQPWPRVLIGVGHLEQWYSSDKVDQDEAFLAVRAVEHSVVRFKGGHEWTQDFRESAGTFLSALSAGN